MVDEPNAGQFPALRKTVEFDGEVSKVREVSPKTGREEFVRDDSPDMPGLQLSLDAGEGRLFLLPSP